MGGWGGAVTHRNRKWGVEMMGGQVGHPSFLTTP